MRHEQVLAAMKRLEHAAGVGPGGRLEGGFSVLAQHAGLSTGQVTEAVFELVADKAIGMVLIKAGGTPVLFRKRVEREMLLSVESTESSPHQEVVLAAVKGLGPDPGVRAAVPFAELAEQTGLDREAVAHAVRLLVQAGLLRYHASTHPREKSQLEWVTS